jgi:DNA-binding transcriptional MerR regulator
MTVSDQETFTIDGLAEETRRWLEANRLDARYYRRVQETPSERTIRYYRTQGLLDAPLKEAGRSLYTRRHMLQLLAIKALQTRGLSHERIQKELYARTGPELEALVAEVLAAGDAAEPPPVRELLEVSLAPGVRLVADRDALAGLDEEARGLLVGRLEATLDALSRPAGRRPRR